jgi:hypothetical protein
MTITTGPVQRTGSGWELPVRVQINRRSLSWLRFVYLHARAASPAAPRWKVAIATLRTIR